MRVLVVTRVPPYPLNTGGAQRSRAILAALAKRHEVTLSCPMPVESRPAAEQNLRPVVAHYIWVDPEDAVPLGMPMGGSRSSRFARYLWDFVTHWTPLHFRRSSRVWKDLLAPACNASDAVLCRRDFTANSDCCVHRCLSVDVGCSINPPPNGTRASSSTTVHVAADRFGHESLNRAAVHAPSLA